MRELVEFIAKGLVDHPDEVRVSQSEGERTTVLELRVAADDLGKIIGREGRTSKALRTILNSASLKLNRRAVLEIVE